MNEKYCDPIIAALEQMGHTQPPTPIQVDNTTAARFPNSTIKQKSLDKLIEFLLVARQNNTGSVSSLLGARNKKLKRLPHQTSLSCTPPSNDTKTFSHRKSSTLFSSMSSSKVWQTRVNSTHNGGCKYYIIYPTPGYPITRLDSHQ